MRDNFLGYMDPANNGYSWGNGAFGVYYNHGGDLGSAPGDRGADTCVMDYPVAGLQAALLINSRGGAYRLLAMGPPSLYQCAALAQAFEEAWIAKK